MPQQISLFKDDQTTGDQVPSISGLGYAPGFLGLSEQVELVRAVDAQPWRSDLQRRVQHYGYKYDYKARRVSEDMFVGELPDFAVGVAKRLLERGLVERMPDQMIVNEYEPGQGISAHVDCEPCFGDSIVTVSLGSACQMDFIAVETGEEKSIMLQPGSALVMTGEARYRWKHRIRARKSDHGVKRGRRISLTFRNVILESEAR